MIAIVLILLLVAVAHHKAYGWTRHSSALSNGNTFSEITHDPRNSSILYIVTDAPEGPPGIFSFSPAQGVREIDAYCNAPDEVSRVNRWRHVQVIDGNIYALRDNLYKTYTNGTALAAFILDLPAETFFVDQRNLAVYYASGDAVRARVLGQQPVDAALDEQCAEPSNIHVMYGKTANSLYYACNSTLWMTRVLGEGATNTVVLDTEQQIVDSDLLNSTLYYTLVDGSVWSLEAASKPTQLLAPGSPLSALAATKDALYFVQGKNALVRFTLADKKRAPSALSVVPQVAHIAPMLASAGAAYVSSRGGISTVASVGAAAVTAVNGGDAARGLAWQDAQTLVACTGTQIVSLPVAGGTPTTLVDKVTDCYSVAYAAQSKTVYWTQRTGASLLLSTVVGSGKVDVLVNSTSPFLSRRSTVRVEGESVYFTEANAVRTLDGKGGAPIVVSSPNTRFELDLAVVQQPAGTTVLYFAEIDGTRVYGYRVGARFAARQVAFDCVGHEIQALAVDRTSTLIDGPLGSDRKCIAATVATTAALTSVCVAPVADAPVTTTSTTAAPSTSTGAISSTTVAAPAAPESNTIYWVISIGFGSILLVGCMYGLFLHYCKVTPKKRSLLRGHDDDETSPLMREASDEILSHHRHR